MVEIVELWLESDSQPLMLRTVKKYKEKGNFSPILKKNEKMGT